MRRDTANIRRPDSLSNHVVTARHVFDEVIDPDLEVTDGEPTDDDGTPLPPLAVSGCEHLDLPLHDDGIPTPVDQLEIPIRLAHPRLIPRASRTRFARASSPWQTPDPDAPTPLLSPIANPVNAPMFLGPQRRTPLPPPLRHRVAPLQQPVDDDRFTEDPETTPKLR